MKDAEALSRSSFPYCRDNVRAFLRCMHGTGKKRRTVAEHALVLSELEKQEAAEIVAACTRLYWDTRSMLKEQAECTARNAGSTSSAGSSNAALNGSAAPDWISLLPLLSRAEHAPLAMKLREMFCAFAGQLWHLFQQREEAVQRQGNRARFRVATAPKMHSTLSTAQPQLETFDEQTALRTTGTVLADKAARRMAVGDLSVRVLRACNEHTCPTAELTAYRNGPSVGCLMRPDKLQFWASKINKTTNRPYRAPQGGALRTVRGVLARLFPWDPTGVSTPEERRERAQSRAVKARESGRGRGRGRGRGQL